MQSEALLTESGGIITTTQLNINNQSANIEMTIGLTDGGFHISRDKEYLFVELVDMVLPCQRYSFKSSEYFNGLPKIYETYKALKSLDHDDDSLIKKLIDIYLPLRLFRVKEYVKMPLVLGFIGQRGSGKTCGAVSVACLDFLIRDIPVWSNVPIKLKVRYRDLEIIYETIPLEKFDMLDLSGGYYGGAALIDEANMEVAEATRFSSGANLDFGYAVQQIRKRQMTVIWTCQGWGWLDNRLRWQTDFLIACRDAYFSNKCLPNGIGDKAIWTVHDLSGMTNSFGYDYHMRHKYVTDYKIGEFWWWNRPWWDAYNSFELQGQENYVASYKDRKIDVKKEIVNSEAERIVNDFISRKIDEIDCKKFYSDYDINGNSRSLKRMITQLLNEYGFVRKVYKSKGIEGYKYTK